MRDIEIIRFDGTTWSFFPIEDMSFDYNARFSSIITDSDNRVWVSTKGNKILSQSWILEGSELLSYDGSSWTKHLEKFSDGISFAPYRLLFADEYNNVWFNNEQGVTLTNGRMFSQMLFLDFFNDVKSAFIDNTGSMWFNTTSGLMSAEWYPLGTSETDVTIPPFSIKFHSLQNEPETFCSISREGIVMTIADVKLYDGEKMNTYLTYYPGIESLTTGSVRTALWIGSKTGGIAMTDGSSVKFTNPYKIWSMASDQDGYLWMGTSVGIRRTNADVFISTAGVYDDKTVISAAVDNANIKWFGTDGNGVIRHDDVTWERIRAEDGGLADNTVKAIVADRNETVWFGTTNGLSSLSDGIWRTYTTENSGIADNTVNVIAADHTNTLWIGTSKGLSRYDGVSWKTITAAGGLPDDNVLTIACAASGDVWVGTETGSAHLDSGGATGVAHEHAVPREIALVSRPNPFNPATTIDFTLPAPGKTRLVVYDVTGRTVAVLVDGFFEAGTHTAVFDGTNLASGVYLARLTAGSTVRTGKMVLVK